MRATAVRTRMLAVGIALGALVASVGFLPASSTEPDQRLNIVVILTDDQSADSIPRTPTVMPFLQERALDPNDHWVVFDQAFVNTPLCCPSRATLLTGRYSQHTGVFDNEDAWRLDEGSTIAALLQGSGYHTGLVGKYLNLYPFGREPFVPSGWDRWWGKAHGPVTTVYQDYTLIEQGRPVRYGDGESDYSTDVYASKAVEFIADAPWDRPFFLWFAPTAPHPPWVPAPRHEGRFADLVVPTTPSVGEADVSDKPAWVRRLRPLDAEARAEMRDARRRSYETLLAVDDAVRAIVDELRARGELDRTLIVFASDNGFSFGEHRWINKTCPYEACLRVPFLVRMPSVAHRIEDEIVSAVDLFPTLAEVAGVPAPSGLDGSSLLDLVRTGSAVGLPGEVFAEWLGDEKLPRWWQVRSSRFAYIELATGERELYDLREDPYELVNVVAERRFADVVRGLAARLDAYRSA
ncbi:MAG TPA: sulfatase [Actinomycetota bacterium]|jgi:arylsulfatase A-like enzyme